MQRLGAPARADQFGGQVFEQLGMRGRRAAQPEVLGRGDEADAEVPLPDPVGLHAGHQRRRPGAGLGEPSRQGEPAARRRGAALGRLDGQLMARVGQHGQGAGLDRGAGADVVAPLEEGDLGGLRRSIAHPGDLPPRPLRASGLLGLHGLLELIALGPERAWRTRTPRPSRPRRPGGRPRSRRCRRRNCGPRRDRSRSLRRAGRAPRGPGPRPRACRRRGAPVGTTPCRRS